MTPSSDTYSRTTSLLIMHLTDRIRWGWWRVRRSAGATLLQEVDRLGDAALPRLVGLGAGDLEHVPRLVAVRQAVEGAPRVRLGVEGGGQVGRHGHLARGGVELHLDVHLVAPGDPGAGAVLGADADHVHPAHHR